MARPFRYDCKCLGEIALRHEHVTHLDIGDGEITLVGIGFGQAVCHLAGCLVRGDRCRKIAAAEANVADTEASPIESPVVLFRLSRADNPPIGGLCLVKRSRFGLKPSMPKHAFDMVWIERGCLGVVLRAFPWSEIAAIDARLRKASAASLLLAQSLLVLGDRLQEEARPLGIYRPPAVPAPSHSEVRA